MDKVWLVTGSAIGLGRNIAEAVLESGDRLVATARDPSLTFALGAHFRRWSRRIPFAFNVGITERDEVKTLPLF